MLYHVISCYIMQYICLSSTIAGYLSCEINQSLVERPNIEKRQEKLSTILVEQDKLANLLAEAASMTEYDPDAS